MQAAAIDRSQPAPGRGRRLTDATNRLLACGAAAAVLITSPAWAADAPSTRVLPPAAAGVLRDVLVSVPGCRLDGVGIEHNIATVRLCALAPPASCFTLQLDDPAEGCAGETSGPWCARWLSGDAPPEVRRAVHDALRGGASPWLDGAAPPSRPGDAPLCLPAGPLGLATAFVVLPLLAGAGLGRRLASRRWLAGGLAAGIGVLSGAAAWLLPRLGAWDVLALGLLLATGVLLGAARIGWRQGALLGLSTGVGLVALEGAARRWLPPPPTYPAPEAATFVLDTGAWDSGCAVLYGTAGVERGLAALRHAADVPQHKAAPLVVHLGDSMTYGPGVDANETFAALLERADPAAAHLNAGVWSVGPDFELLLLRALLDTQTPAVVLLHVFLGNDAADIDRPYECCADGPLLRYTPVGPVARCPTPHWGLPWAAHLGRSPAPYPLRAATAWSIAARHAVTAFARLGFQLDRPPHFIDAQRTAGDGAWQHFALILTAMRDLLAQRGVAFVVTLLPLRQELDAPPNADAPAQTARRHLLAITAQLGIPTLDAWDLFADAVRRDGAARYFLPEDVHFSPPGHRLLAEWLLARLAPPARPAQEVPTRGD